MSEKNEIKESVAVGSDSNDGLGAKVKIKTWGDIYNAALARGEDNGYAAYLADEYEKRMERKSKK